MFVCVWTNSSKSNQKSKENLFWSIFWSQHSHESCFLRCQGQERGKMEQMHYWEKVESCISSSLLLPKTSRGEGGGGVIVCNKTKSILSFLPCLDLKLYWHNCKYHIAVNFSSTLAAVYHIIQLLTITYFIPLYS